MSPPPANTPLLELAHVRLKPEFDPSNLPPSFTQAWTSACSAATSAAGIRFQLYQSTTQPEDFFFVGGWAAGEDHVRFLGSEEARVLARAIGAYASIVGVHHVAADVGVLDAAGRAEGGKTLDLREFGVGKQQMAEFVEMRNQGPATTCKSGGIAAGWDVSEQVQRKHKEFGQVAREAGSDLAAVQNHQSGEEEEMVWVEVSVREAGVHVKDDAAGSKGYALQYCLG